MNVSLLTPPEYLGDLKYIHTNVHQLRPHHTSSLITAQFQLNTVSAFTAAAYWRKFPTYPTKLIKYHLQLD